MSSEESPEPEVQNLPVKARKKREMTPELLEKLKLARERAAELRNMAKETKQKLPSHIPEKEKTKVAQYLATRKAIKEKIQQEIVEEIEKSPSTKTVKEPEFQLATKSTEPPPPLPKSVRVKPPPESSSDEEEEYTTIKIPKKKIIKWNKKAQEPHLHPPPIPEQPKKQFNFNQHLIGLAMSGYKF
jgi:hypothetical protein